MADTSFVLRLNTLSTERAFQRLKDRAPAAIARALNRAGTSGATLGIRLVSQDTGIRQSDLKGTTKRNRRVWKSEAVPGREAIRVYAALAQIPLMDFGARGPVPSRGKGRGVTARLRGGAGRYPHAFIATMPSGHKGVFGRRKRSMAEITSRAFKRGLRLAAGRKAGAEIPLGGMAGRLPIAELSGPSVAHVWMKHAAEITQRAVVQLRKNLASEFRYVTGKGGNA